MIKRKGANIMTNVLINAENIIDNYCEEPKNSKLETILLYCKIKKVINEDYAQSLVKKYIEKDKAINSGRATIKGTRVTPEDIGRILLIKENMKIKDIMKEYPSLNNEEEVLAGLIYYMSKNISLRKILFAK